MKHQQSIEKIAIVVLNWNGKEDTKRCLDSLMQVSRDEVIVVDNGSTDGSVPYLKSLFPTCTFIENGHNLGYAGGNNVGISYALKEGFNYLLILNNDTVVDSQILNAFLEGFEKDPKVGILGGKIYRMDEPDKLDHFGGNWNGKRLDFDYVGYRAMDAGWDRPIEIDYVCGAALMVKREVFEAIGLFDPRYFLFWEESDFCFRARRRGFLIKTCPQAKVWHKVSASFTGGKPHAAYFLGRNRLLWIEKNLSGWERGEALSRILLFSLPSFYLQKVLRKSQLLLQTLRKKKTTRNKERLVRIEATICGIHDYLIRHFEAGRSKKFMNCD